MWSCGLLGAMSISLHQAVATLKVIRDEKLLDNATARGEQLMVLY